MESFNYLNNQLNKLFHHTPNLNFSRFDTWEQETVNHIVKIYKNGGVGDYTYGNGQKLVNMAIKFVLSSDLIDYNHDVFKYCHIPVDGIIQKIAKERLGVDLLHWNGEEKDFYSSWSKNDYRADFLDYQERIRKAIQEKGDYSPLIWEIENWKP